MLRRLPNLVASGATLLNISKLLARFTRLRRTKLLLRHFPLAKMSTPIAEKVVGPSKPSLSLMRRSRRTLQDIQHIVSIWIVWLPVKKD